MTAGRGEDTPRLEQNSDSQHNEKGELMEAAISLADLQFERMPIEEAAEVLALEGDERREKQLDRRTTLHMTTAPDGRELGMIELRDLGEYIGVKLAAKTHSLN